MRRLGVDVLLADDVTGHERRLAGVRAACAQLLDAVSVFRSFVFPERR